jgi:hypothetical protein
MFTRYAVELWMNGCNISNMNVVVWVRRIWWWWWC